MSDSLVRIIPPQNINDSNLTSSNVPENDYPLYDSGTTYNEGDKVIITTGVHKIYESTVTQTGVYPPENLVSWIDKGSTNRFKMFDDAVASKTVNPNTINVSLTMNGLVNSLALLELNAISVTITANSQSSGLVYNKTIDLIDYSEITDWYQYFYYEFQRKSTLVITDLPAYNDLTVNIIIDNNSGNAECGVLGIGRQNIIGEALYGVKIGIIDYSIKTVNDAGLVNIKEGAFSKRADIPVKIENNKIDSTHSLLASNRARSIIYAVTNRFDSTLIYGYYKDFDITIAHPAFAECGLSIEGLI